MALCPFATHKLLPENRYQPHITPYAAIWHSAVDGPGRTSLYGYFNRDEVTLESHFHILWDGTIEQYMDTTVRADANYRANGFWKSGKYVGAISVETEDDGDPNRRPWSPDQVAASVRLGQWIREEHPQIPAELCPEWDAPGFGYHTLFPKMWTNVRGKTCPGTIRIPQFKNEILPAIAGNEEGMLTDREFIKTQFGVWLRRTAASEEELNNHLAYVAFHGREAALDNLAHSEEAELKR